MGAKSRSAARVLPAIVLLLIAILPIRVGLVWQTAEQMANAEETKPEGATHGTAASAEPVSVESPIWNLPNLWNKRPSNRRLSPLLSPSIPRP